MRKHWPLLLGALWIAAIASGFRVLRRYETTPGRSGAAPLRWPADSRVPLAADRSTLVMLAHPHCPCTRAGVEELARLMARLQGRARAHVLFYQPAAMPDGWTETPSWREASAIPGVTARRDKGGVDAGRFAVWTSGQVVLYDHEGRLLFSGGITGLRGHVGDNAGSRAIVSLLTGGTPAVAGAPVLGCALGGG